MIIGVAKEIKNNENRVGLTPAGTEALVKAGHKVLIEKDGGLGSGFTDENYKAVGAEIVSAVSQAKIYKDIEPFLTEDEQKIFRRGRNAKSHAPRAATVAEYHASTGFESLLGELFLRKNFSRLEEICELALNGREIFSDK